MKMEADNRWIHLPIPIAARPPPCHPTAGANRRPRSDRRPLRPGLLLGGRRRQAFQQLLQQALRVGALPGQIVRQSSQTTLQMSESRMRRRQAERRRPGHAPCAARGRVLVRRAGRRGHDGDAALRLKGVKCVTGARSVYVQSNILKKNNEY